MSKHPRSPFSSPSSSTGQGDDSPPRRKKSAIVTPNYTEEGDGAQPEFATSLSNHFEGEDNETTLPPLRAFSVNKLSDQQLEVVKLARPPAITTKGDFGSSSNKIVPRHLVRVTAAAGSGKTTLLLYLALRCVDLGHEDIMYVTFSKASAKDAQARFRDMQLSAGITGASINASTLHSCAYHLVNDDPFSSDSDDDDDDDDDDNDDSDKKDGDICFVSDDKFLKMIESKFDSQIESHLKTAYDYVDLQTADKREREVKKAQMKKQVMFYLKKTFWTFCTNNLTLEELKNGRTWNRHYYPVTQHFKPGEIAAKLGFPVVYNEPSRFRFYADLCVKIWEYVYKKDIRTHDINMKKAQLKGLHIPCSVLLVDECQDLDACQTSWVERQLIFGTHVFLVGDAAQTIYSFRGAKSSNVMSLPGGTDKFLTKSWRFGTPIARIANIALFAKDHSPQTSYYVGKERKLWIPYRVDGGREGDESVVTTESLCETWEKHGQVTLLAHGNGTLIMKAMDLLGMSCLKTSSDDLSQTNALPNFDFSSCPKFHVNGKGDSSGLSKWRGVAKEIESLYLLYAGQTNKLPANKFPEFQGDGDLTWNKFTNIITAREITKFVPHIAIIETYGKNTVLAMSKFRDEVMEKNYDPEDADIILSTCHSAKGMEWDNVELCDDFVDLDKTIFSEGPSGEKEKYQNTKWEFRLKNYGDDVNLLYVALTRAKKVLCVPRSIQSLILHFCMLGSYLDASVAQESMRVGDREFSDAEGSKLCEDLYLPLREELGVSMHTILEE